MITIIIPIFNGERYVEDCLESIFSQSFNLFQVVIFDNGSQDRSRQLAEKYPVKILGSPQNLGWAKANNICISQATTKYVLLLNVDTILHRNCLKLLFEFAESKDDMACVSPTIIEYSLHATQSVEHGYPLVFDIESGLIKAYEVSDAYVETSFIPGTAMFANLRNTEKYLRFREDFYMYHEDVELSLSILTQTEFKLYYLKDAIVAHDSRQSYSRLSTCRLAIRNLFTCLTEYQDYRNFLRHYFSYSRNLCSNYSSYYKRFYPVAYPLFSFFYLLQSVFKMNRRGPSLSRLHQINLTMEKYPLKFKFIF